MPDRPAHGGYPDAAASSPPAPPHLTDEDGERYYVRADLAASPAAALQIVVETFGISEPECYEISSEPREMQGYDRDGELDWWMPVGLEPEHDAALTLAPGARARYWTLEA